MNDPQRPVVESRPHRLRSVASGYGAGVRAGDLIENYRLVNDLGAGAFATVWLAEDQYLDDLVAIKVLADNWARDPEIRDRFIEEARIMRRIDHPRIVRVFTVGALPSGQPMFVMTYADRGTLADRIRDRRAQARRFTTHEVVEMMIDLTDCLAVVHDFGIVHRDLKPSNVLYRTTRRHERTSDGRDVMLLGDFGLAKDTVARSGFTMAAGTPAYMAPEQARATSELDHRADLYAATAILFELLTGTAPFDASTLSGVRRDRIEPRIMLDRHQIPPGWDVVIERGLATEPAHRFQSAQELADAVRALAPAGANVTSQISLLATATGDAELVGIRGTVAAIVARFGRERSASIDERLRRPPLVAAVDLPDSTVDQITNAVDERGMRFIQLAADDARLGEVDVVVATAADRERVIASIADAPAGPISIIDDLDDDEARTHVFDLTARRSDAIRASAALAQLDGDVKRAGSVAMSDAWMSVRDQVETLRFEMPMFAELAAVRSETAQRILLPASRRAALRRILLEIDLADRLGVAASANESEMLDAVVVQVGEWRAFADSGRVPFSSRGAVEVVVRCLERLWSGLTGFDSDGR